MNLLRGIGHAVSNAGSELIRRQQEEEERRLRGEAVSAGMGIYSNAIQPDTPEYNAATQKLGSQGFNPVAFMPPAPPPTRDPYRTVNDQLGRVAIDAQGNEVWHPVAGAPTAAPAVEEPGTPPRVQGADGRWYTVTMDESGSPVGTPVMTTGGEPLVGRVPGAGGSDGPAYLSSDHERAVQYIMDQVGVEDEDGELRLPAGMDMSWVHEKAAEWVKHPDRMPNLSPPSAMSNFQQFMGGVQQRSQGVGATMPPPDDRSWMGPVGGSRIPPPGTRSRSVPPPRGRGMNPDSLNINRNSPLDDRWGGGR